MTRTPTLGESHPTRVPKRLAETDISAVNLDKSSSMTSVKGMDPLEASSSAIHLPSEVGINQVFKSEKVINYSSWKYVPELFLDVIKDSEGGTQEITTTQQLALWKYMRQ